MKKNNQLAIIELLIIAILSLTPFLWFRHGEVVLGHDSGWRLDPIVGSQQLFFSWYPTVNFGTDRTISKGFLITQMPEALFYQITNSLQLAQTLSFVFWMFAMGAGMYWCMRKLFAHSQYWIIRMSASVYWMCNFFVLQAWFISERAKFSLLAALPIGFALLVEACEGRQKWFNTAVVIAIIFFFFNGGSSPPLFGGIILIYGTTILWYVIRAAQKKQWKEVVTILSGVTACISMTVLVNAYWLLPQLSQLLSGFSSGLSSLGGVSGIIAWEAAVNRYASFINLFRLQGIPDWYDNPFHPYAHTYLSNPLLIMAGFIPCLILFWGLQRKVKQDGEKISAVQNLFLGIFPISLLFAAGSHKPFGFIYLFALQHIPGFAMFRSAFYKFGSAYWFVFIVLFAMSCYTLINFVKNRVLRLVFGIGIILYIVFFHAPLFQGTFFDWNAPFTTRVVIPKYVRNAADYLKSTTMSDDRLLLLPRLDPNSQADGYTWGYWSLDVLLRSGLDRSIVVNDSSAPAPIASLYAAIDRRDKAGVLSMLARLGITRIVWRNDVLFSDKLTTSRVLAGQIDFIKSISGVLHDKTFDKWQIYRLSEKTMPRAALVNSLVYAQAPAEEFVEISQATSLTEKQSIVFAGDPGASAAESLSPNLIGAKVISTACQLCLPTSERQLEKDIELPYVRFLPDSPFFALTEWKDARALARYSTVPASLIDTILRISSKRIIEVQQLLTRPNKSGMEKIIQVPLRGYEGLIDRLPGTLEKMGGPDHSEYAIKIRAYLRVHSQLLATMKFDGVLADDTFNATHELINSTIDKIQRQIWQTREETSKRFIVQVPSAGAYSMVVPRADDLPSEVKLNDRKIKLDEQINLPAGIGKIEFVYPVPENLLGKLVKPGALELPIGSDLLIPIAPFDYSRRYALMLSYSIMSSHGALISLVQPNDRLRTNNSFEHNMAMPLIDDGKLHHVKYVLHPNYGATSLTITLTPYGLETTPNEVIIHDFSVYPVKVPLAYLVSRASHVDDSANSSVGLERYDSTLYKARVPGLNDTTIFRFGEQYDSGWRAYLIPRGSNLTSAWQTLVTVITKANLVPVNRHIKIDGYANGWILEKRDESEMVLVFWPQVVFYEGVIVTVLGVLAIGTLAVVRRYYGKN